MTDQPKLTPVSAVPRLFRSPISTAARTTEILELLGRTADEVALNLFNDGCFGPALDCGACPVAVYLLRSDLRPYAVSVGDVEIALHFSDDPDDVQYVDVTDAVSAFVSRLDSGWYPQLTAQAVTA